MDIAADHSRPHPFAHTTDQNVFYRSPIHESACAELVAAAKTHGGLLVLSGEPGTGKTTVLHRVAHDLEQAGVRVLRFSDVGPVLEMFHPIGREPGTLEAAPPTTRRDAFLTALQARLRSEGATVVVLDEAQRLGPLELGLLRDLVEAERMAGRRLAVLLVGQSGFDVKLGCLEGDRADRAFALRILLSPLETSDVRAYMAYRLEQAGSRLDDVFETDAVDRIAAYAQGLPRVINQLCHGALRTASEAGLTTASASTVDAAAGWLDLDLPRLAGAAVTVAGRPAGRRMGGWARGAASGRVMLWAWSRDAGMSIVAVSRVAGRRVGVWARRVAWAGATQWEWTRGAGASTVAVSRAAGRRMGAWVRGAASGRVMLWAWSRDTTASVASARTGGRGIGTWVAARATYAGATLGAWPRRMGAAVAAAWRAAGRRIETWVADQVVSMPAKIQARLPDASLAALVLAVIALVIALWPTSYQAPPVGFTPGLPLPASTGQLIERPPPSHTPQRLERPPDTGLKPSVRAGPRSGSPPRVTSGTPRPAARQPGTFSDARPSAETPHRGTSGTRGAAARQPGTFSDIRPSDR